MPGKIRCLGCGALVADVAGPTHRYMLSAPGCWQLYGRLLGAEYPWTQLSVDGYAVQHPGQPGPQANQSVCVHLMNLCRVLERGGGLAGSADFLRGLTHRDYPSLTPPGAVYETTVVDVLKVGDQEAFGAFESGFAATGWSAWCAHHSTVRRWLDEPGSLPPQRKLRQ